MLKLSQLFINITLTIMSYCDKGSYQGSRKMGFPLTHTSHIYVQCLRTRNKKEKRVVINLLELLSSESAVIPP
jgi:hypothetical protein